MDEMASSQPAQANQGGVQGTNKLDSSRFASRRDEILRKKKRVEKMHSFSSLKKKIYTLASFKRIDEAKDAYNSLYMLYNELLQISNDKEKQELRAEVSSVYEKMLELISAKRVKKGKIEANSDDVEVKRKSDVKALRKKIITTDLDVVVGIIEDKGKVNLADIQSRFAITRELAEEWIQILADYGLVHIHYLPVGGVEITKVS